MKTNLNITGRTKQTTRQHGTSRNKTKVILHTAQLPVKETRGIRTSREIFTLKMISKQNRCS